MKGYKKLYYLSNPSGLLTQPQPMTFDLPCVFEVHFALLDARSRMNSLRKGKEGRKEESKRYPKAKEVVIPIIFGGKKWILECFIYSIAPFGDKR